ncbi:MAG: hypothetical protein GXX09_12025 [Syntrophomonadaceae bacterium]|nr:hypothetical protein [Syntrophomonadaceae bacterium]
MAELRNCPECGQLFAYQGKDLCPKCTEVEEQEFTIVRQYVRKHPGATILQVAEETGVDEEKILRFLKEGRLVSKGLAAGASITCERCGARIEQGRYCRSCVQELDNALRQTIATMKKDDREGREAPAGRGKERMYVKDIRDKDKDNPSRLR